MVDVMEIRNAKNDDFEKLVDIRIRAMKPSLEKVGRFDKTRATERFRKSFIPEQTILVVENEKIQGFYIITLENKRLFLNHLYIDPEFQGNGIGRKLLEQVMDIARESGKSIELEALKESRSNSFYCTNGFIKIGESEFDNLYRWKGL
jgi:ribosomal protein S18 acetylase RimI-like enzyme